MLGRHHLGLLALTCDHGIAHQHRGGAVELLGQSRIALTAENRAGERVGVDEAEFVGREGEAAARVGQLFDLPGKTYKLCRFGLTECKQAELEAAVHGGKQCIAVFNVVQADQPPALRDVAKVGLGAVVGGNAGGHDETRAARGRGDLQHGFGKQRVGVQFAHGRKREPARLSVKGVGGRNALALDDKGLPQRRVLLLQLCNCPFALVALQGGDLWRAGGEEFLLAHLRDFPRRVAQHAVKTACRKHLGKGQRPVQHARLLAGGAGGGHGGVLRVGGVGQPVRGRQGHVQRLAGGYQRGGGGRFGQQVGTYSQIGRQGKRAVR